MTLGGSEHRKTRRTTANERPSGRPHGRLARAVELKREQPRSSHVVINRILKQESGRGVPRSTLYRHLHREGATRRKLGVSQEKIRCRWTRNASGALWVGDFEHGPPVLLRGRAMPTRLYLPSTPKIGRSKLYTILTDRAYIGEIKFRGQWLPGTHSPIIDQRLWDRVQTLLGQKVYKQHQMTYASDLIECAHCGSPITGQRKFKMTKSGEREYVYYRCTQYHKGDHPRIRLTENELDAQMLAIFDTLRVEDAEFRDTFREELRKADELGRAVLSKES